ncbi:MAG: ribosomal protein S13 [Candidatus Parvarchaeum acidophilus ARMAN-5]|jgi:small subunit ribosomal protein S13|uniref:30S ribosomal protein S13 n=1 Tax=Candidatus Parvarchaeum acidophilus ARMAN-5 TaxID=662762 RepID=D6GVN4_PARA5|nr:MAG: ribosomal protein S13 [Candidatus Parvarchaeum acidophilus ARMAN-5]
MQANKHAVKSVKGEQEKKPVDMQERRIVRIADTDLDGSKAVKDLLRSIPGISFSYSNALMKVLNIPKGKKLQDLDEKELNTLKEALSDPFKYKIPHWLFNWRRDDETGLDYHLLSNDLRSKTTMRIQKIKTSRSYRGYRHSFNYKLRGQKVKSRGANVHGRVGSSLGVVKKKQAQQGAK